MSKKNISEPLVGEAIQKRWEKLSSLLFENDVLWKTQTYKLRTVPWREDFPALAAWLETLTLEQVRSFETELPSFLSTAVKYVPSLLELHEQAFLGHFKEVEQKRASGRWLWKLPGRKRVQSEAFARCMWNPQTPLLEWCSGKGHLARRLVEAFDQPAICLERDAALCQKGQEQADYQEVAVRYVEQDVLKPEATKFLGPKRHLVALHACGELHRRLLVEGVRCGVSAFSVVPCCYHLDSSEEYVAFSEQGNAFNAGLHRDHLRLVMQEAVTGSKRRTMQRIHGSQWRLAFDLLQREVRGCDTYLPLPSFSRSELEQTFPEFCAKMAERVGLSIPATMQVAPFEALGRARYRRNAAFELLRVAFLRPLEVWLVLDRALFLLEKKYHVAVGTFCEKTSTPRNLLIQAQTLS